MPDPMPTKSTITAFLLMVAAGVAARWIYEAYLSPDIGENP